MTTEPPVEAITDSPAQVGPIERFFRERDVLDWQSEAGSINFGALRDRLISSDALFYVPVTLLAVVAVAGMTTLIGRQKAEARARNHVPIVLDQKVDTNGRVRQAIVIGDTGARTRVNLPASSVVAKVRIKTVPASNLGPACTELESSGPDGHWETVLSFNTDYGDHYGIPDREQHQVGPVRLGTKCPTDSKTKFDVTDLGGIGR